jgi:hypothetical protein
MNMPKKDSGVTPRSESEAAPDIKSTLQALGCVRAWEFEQHLPRGGFFVVGFTGPGLLLILIEHYEAERDAIGRSEVFVPLAALKDEALATRLREVTTR